MRLHPSSPAQTGKRLRRATVAALAAVAITGPAAVASEPLGPQLAIAHRGASKYAPEHTFLAYDTAMAMDVDMLECDLQLTSDEVLVCIHDDTVDRTSDGTGRVDSFTLDGLRGLDWGSWKNEQFAGAQIVPFEEQLDCYLRHNGRMRFHVETKGPATYGGRMEELLAELLNRKGLIDTGDVNTSTILAQSFEPESLALVKQQAPTLPTALLNFAPDPVQAIALHQAGIIDAVAPILDGFAVPGIEQAIDAIHADGIPIHVWTVSDDAALRDMVALGVDGIFTNTPDLARAAIDEVGVPTDPMERGNSDEFDRGCPGIAGRVTSSAGPGDVWAPAADGRGVTLVTPSPLLGQNAATTQDADAPASEADAAPGPSSSPAPVLPVTGGGLAGLATVAFGLAARLRRR